MLHSTLRPPRNVLVLFLAVSAVSVSALVWLSWRLHDTCRTFLDTPSRQAICWS
jgi:hypothetical protein